MSAQRLVLVGPAVRRIASTVPADTIVIHGEEDDVVPLAEVFAWARPQQLPVVVFPGCGHFFHGRLLAAAAHDRRHVAWTRGDAGCLTPRILSCIRRPGSARARRRAPRSCCASRVCANRTARTRSSAGCPSRSAAASASACSARTALARPPRSAAASVSSSPTAARSTWWEPPFPGPRGQARARVGVVPQQDNLDPDFTVTENLQVYGRYFGIDARTLATRIPELLEFAGLDEAGQDGAAHAVGRHEAAPDACAGAHQRSGAPDPRRAHDRDSIRRRGTSSGTACGNCCRKARRSCSRRISWTRRSVSHPASP